VTVWRVTSLSRRRVLFSLSPLSRRRHLPRKPVANLNEVRHGTSWWDRQRRAGLDLRAAGPIRHLSARTAVRWRTVWVRVSLGRSVWGERLLEGDAGSSSQATP
jgi:hypothetical protein